MESLPSQEEPSEFAAELRGWGRLMFIFCFLAALSLPSLISPSSQAAEGAAEKTPQAVLERARKAAGGAERLRGIKDVTRTIKRDVMGGMVTVEQTIQVLVPDLVRQQVNVRGQFVTVVADASGGWMKVAGKDSVELNETQLREARGVLFRLPEILLLSDSMKGRTLEYVGEKEVEGQRADVIRISEGELGIELWVGVDDGSILKTAYDETRQGKRIKVEELMSNYTETDGIRIPSEFSVFQDGMNLSQVTVSKVTYNTGLSRGELLEK